MSTPPGVGILMCGACSSIMRRSESCCLGEPDFDRVAVGGLKVLVWTRSESASETASFPVKCVFQTNSKFDDGAPAALAVRLTPPSGPHEAGSRKREEGTFSRFRGRKAAYRVSLHTSMPKRQVDRLPQGSGVSSSPWGAA